jgi:hypothetical protein
VKVRVKVRAGAVMQCLHSMPLSTAPSFLPIDVCFWFISLLTYLLTLVAFLFKNSLLWMTPRNENLVN